MIRYTLFLIVFVFNMASAQECNADANTEDGSCEYPYLCASNQLLLTMYAVEEDGWEGIR